MEIESVTIGKGTQKMCGYQGATADGDFVHFADMSMKFKPVGIWSYMLHMTEHIGTHTH